MQFREYIRNDSASIDRWILNIILFPCYIFIFLSILDITFYPIMQRALNVVAIGGIKHSQVKQYPQDIQGARAAASYRCELALERLRKHAHFGGYTAESRDQFLESLQRGAQYMDDSANHNINGCYYHQDTATGAYFFTIAVRGQRHNGNGIWPVFTRSLLTSMNINLKQKPFIMHGVQSDKL